MPRQRDVIQNSSTLLKIIQDLHQIGVALECVDSGGNRQLEVQRLSVFTAGLGKDNSFESCTLSEADTNVFLRLRKLQRESTDLQKEYRDSRNSKTPQEKSLPKKKKK